MLTKLKSFVEGLSSTNWTIATGTVAGFITCVAYIASWFLGREPSIDTWIAWLAFLASWIGFGVKQFKHKRETFKPGGPQDASVRTEQPTKG